MGPVAPDVSVIGGGIAGTATATFLAEAGLRVRLYERDAIASGASGRNSGIVQHPFDAVLADLYVRTLIEYHRLAREPVLGFALGDEPVGLLYVGRDGGSVARIAEAWAGAWPDSRPEVLDGVALTRLEPALAPDLVACRLAIGYPVAPAAATEAFAGRARALGVEIVVGGGDARPAIFGKRVVGVERNGRIDPAGAVVVAGGPWTPGLIDPTATWRPVRPSWGVVANLVVEGAPRHGLEAADIDIEPADGAGPAGEWPEAGPTPRHDPIRDEDIEFSLVPAAGASALGSTFLAGEPEPESWLPALRRVGSRYVPAVADAPVVGMRCCARPVSHDGRPLVGPVPWIDGLWMIAGHGPWGISTGPGSARRLSDAILGTGPQAMPAALAVDRFGVPGHRRDRIGR